MLRSCRPHVASGLGPLLLVSLWLAIPVAIAKPLASTPATSSIARIVSTVSTLSESEAVARALKGPGLHKISASITQAASAVERRASTWKNPVFGGERESSLSDAAVSENLISLTFPLDLSGGRGLRADAAAIRQQLAGHEVHGLEADVIAATRRAFAEASRAALRDEVLIRWGEALSQTRRVIAARVAAGSVAEWALARIDRERGEAARLQAVAELDVAEAWAELAGLTGLSPALVARPVFSGALLSDAPAEAAFPGAALEVALGVALRAADLAPRLRAFEAERRAVALELRAAERAWIPALALSAGYKYLDADGRADHGVVFGLEFPLPVFDRGQADVAHARADALRVAGRHERELARRRAQVQAQHHEVRRLRAVLVAYQRDVVDASRRLVVLADRAYQSGELGLLELLDAQRGARDAELQALALALRTRHARIRLERETHGGSR